jgi:3-deoxy-manno-octulosonate cytidylyltransferase (CMP-KDO synthetase)
MLRKSQMKTCGGNNMSEASIIIPARYDSSRYPGKPLEKINGKEMILHVADGCAPAFGKDHVYIVTDDDRINAVVTKAGYKVIMTLKDQVFNTGSDRVSYASAFLDSHYIINVQGDEPLINPVDIRNVYGTLMHNPGYIVNCYSPCSNSDNGKENKNTIKVILNNHESEFQTLRYMSRSPIPTKSINYKKQVCIYGWDRYTLMDMFGEKKECSETEESEDVEILRVLDCGRKVKMVAVMGNYQAVDTPKDIKKVEKILNERK